MQERSMLIHMIHDLDRRNEILIEEMSTLLRIKFLRSLMPQYRIVDILIASGPGLMDRSSVSSVDCFTC